MKTKLCTDCIQFRYFLYYFR